MLSNSESDPLPRVIPMTVVGQQLDCTPITARRACIRHGVPITRLSKAKHGLTPENYRLLLARASRVSR
jgi:hypothetical protein